MLCIIRIRAVNVAYEEVSQWLVTERLNRHWPLKFCLWGILHKSSSVQSVWTLVANLFEIVTFLFWLKKKKYPDRKQVKEERVSFCLQFQRTRVHHDEDDMTAGMWDQPGSQGSDWEYFSSAQEAERLRTGTGIMLYNDLQTPAPYPVSFFLQQGSNHLLRVLWIVSQAGNHIKQMSL